MPTHDELVTAASQLARTIRSEARSAEIARQPSDLVIADARRSGLFTLMAPAKYGGSELDLDTFFDVGVLLAEADGSHGWLLNFYIEHVWMFSQFPESFQNELFAETSYVLAPAILAPTGKAEPVDGGFQVSGRFSWGTGIVHADWVIVGAISTGLQGPMPRFLALPASEVKWEDTWHMDGMAGTGSHDIVVHDRFVPEDRTVDIGQMLNARAPGSHLHDGPLYSTPMAPILSFAASLPVLGQARSAVREFGDQLAGRFDMVLGTPQTERPARQILLARSDLNVRAAEALMRSILREVMELRADADEATRVRWTSSLAHAVTMCRQAIEELCNAAGATAHKLENPLQRTRRDVNAMACHVVFDSDERNLGHGRALLGLPTQSLWH